MREVETQIQKILAEVGEQPPESGSSPLALHPLTVRLARALLTAAHAAESAQERKARAAVSQLVQSDANQAFSVALTDRIVRTKTATSACSAFRELIARIDPSPGLGPWDRLQLKVGDYLADFIPDLVHAAIEKRVVSEVQPFLLTAEEPNLSYELHERRQKLGSVNLNYLGEEVLGDEDARARISTYSTLARRSDVDAMSVKLSGIDARLNPIAIEENVARLFRSVNEIAQGTRGSVRSPIIYFDMEAYRDLEMAELLLLSLLRAEPETQGWSPAIQFGLAVQAYLPESLGLIERLAEASAHRVRQGGKPLRVRLVKGANLHTERVEASLRGLRSPIFSTKLETDAHFKRCLRRSIEHAQSGSLQVGVGSHNLFDLSYALLLRAQAGVQGDVQLEMLEGMAGALGRTIAATTGALLIYTPAVEQTHFISAVSYLVRRLDENTEPEHFMRDAAGMEVDDASFERQQRAFLASLEESWITPPLTFRKQNRYRPTRTGRFNRRGEFHNCADTDWSRPNNRKWLSECYAKAEADAAVPPRGGDAPHVSSSGFDPSRPEFSYPIALAGPAGIEEVLARAEGSKAGWAKTEPPARIELLRKIAFCLEERRGDLIAAMTLDAGKRALEADIEVSEAIDFARYYAHIAEKDALSGTPLGVVVVTPPWNFPLAIPLGGVLAALVAGNPVVLKPAPETPWVARLATDCCHEAGVPHDVLQCTPCEDEQASPLIMDERVSAVVLTGATSTARSFLKMRPQLRLMAETGGKNAAYVSALSDREQAISHIVQSAFGHAGQKCSALSVLILEREVFEDEDFNRQLLEATRTLLLGSAWDASSFITPLIAPPRGPLASIVSEGHLHGTWLLQPKIDEKNPRLLSPGILWGVEPGSFPHLTEFFGPVLSVLCAEDFNHGMDLLNATGYGLTAGLFSLLESEQEQFVGRADAGNLYVNRTLTGAVVGRQPFGGRKMSGFGPGAKAGGPDYVRLFERPAPLTDRTQLEEARIDYHKCMIEHFAKVHPGTKVVGEDNFLRYQTARTIVAVGNHAPPASLAATLLAKNLSRNAYSVFYVGNESSAVLEQNFQEAAQLSRCPLGALYTRATLDELFAYCQEHGIERIRVVGQADPALFLAASRIPITVLSDPVSRWGRFELAFYFMGQSISHSYHRYGNLKLHRASRLCQTLEQAARALRADLD